MNFPQIVLSLSSSLENNKFSNGRRWIFFFRVANFHRYPKHCESLAIVFVFGVGFLWYLGRTVSFKPLVVIQKPLAVCIPEDALSVRDELSSVVRLE